jgi:hypothetical protein
MDFENLDQALAALKDLESRMNSVENENAKLKATRQGLQADLKKKKAVDSFLKVAGIELSQDMTEEEIAEKIVSLRSSRPESQADDEQDGEETQQQRPQSTQQQPPQPQSYQQPSEAMDTAIKAQIASLKRQNEEQKKMLHQITEERDKEREQRRAARLEQKVMDELSKVDCRRANHLFKLERENFRLLEDEETVVYGSQDEPMGLREAISRLREDDEYSVYFNGSGASGSGLSATRTIAYTSGNNPFASGSVNATQAAELFTKNPDKARRLMNEARAAGKLDALMARAFAAS